MTPALVAGILSDTKRSPADLLAENALLRHRLIVLRRQVKRPQLTTADRTRLVGVTAKLDGGSCLCGQPSHPVCDWSADVMFSGDWPCVLPMEAPMNSWTSLADDSALLLTPLSSPEVTHSLPAGSRLRFPTAEPVRSVLPLADFLIRSESYLQLTQIVPVCLSYPFGIDNSPIEVNKHFILVFRFAHSCQLIMTQSI